MRRTIIQLAIVSTALAVIAPALAAPRATTVAAPAPETTAASASAPTPAAAQTAGLCGLTQADVAGIVDHYDLEPNWAGFAAALQVPFNCAAYGDLCSAVGAAAAETYACGVWNGLEARASLEAIQHGAVTWLGNNGTACTPNQAVCEDICDGMGGVKTCTGILVNGICRSIALCDLFVIREKLFPFIEVVEPIW